MDRYHKRRVISALRFEVELDISTWKTVNPFIKGSLCPEAGTKMLKTKSEVDHIIPFAKLVDDFLSEEKIGFADVQITYHARIKQWRLQDNEVSYKWRKYHLANMKLQWISKEGNKAKSDSGYRKSKGKGQFT
jgi:hypothetical protein